MTTDSPGQRSDSGPSVHVVRARKLLFAGLVGGVGAGLLCILVFAVLDGLSGLLSAALGAALVVAFYALGQFVMVVFADAGARLLLMVSMASYTGRVVFLGLILLIININRDRLSGLDTMTVFIAAIAAVVGWLVVEVFTFNRLRIGIYDTEYDDSQAAARAAEDDDPRPHLAASPGGEERA